MNEKWSLDILYKGYDDPKFAEDLKKADALIEKTHKLSAALDPNKRKETIIEIIKLMEESEVLSGELFHFVSLQSEADTTDEFYNGWFVPCQWNGSYHYGMQYDKAFKVVIWRGDNNDNIHATPKLDRESWEVVKS